jgi:hypothetical protein
MPAASLRILTPDELQFDCKVRPPHELEIYIRSNVIYRTISRNKVKHKYHLNNMHDKITLG